MNVLFIPIFSMRSHETGKYAILKDGNFQLALNRVLGSDFDEVTIAVPRNSSDYTGTCVLLDELRKTRRAVRGQDYELFLLELDYGDNAVDTRKTFWERNHEHLNCHIHEYDLVVTDVTAFPYDVPFVNNFNITKIPQLVRPYIDEFFEIDVESCHHALFTTVLNQVQKDALVEAGVPEEKVHVYQKVCCDLYYQANRSEPIRLLEENEIFWPFRISDKAYRFEEFIEQFEAQNLDKWFKVVITDPNDSYKLDKPYIRKIKPSKAEYYGILSQQPRVVMLDDVDLVLHPGTIEFFFFGCRVIVFKNDVIHTNYAITDLSELIKYLFKDEPVKYSVEKFVYNFWNTSELYNKKFCACK